MKIQLKQTVAAVLTSAVLFTSTHANASGIPTVDGAAIAQAVQEMVMGTTQHAETIAQWGTQAQQMIEQINHLKTQIQNQIDTFNAIKNVDDLDSVLKAIDDIANMPEEWADMYKTIEKIDPTKELEKLKFDPELAMKNAMKDIAALDILRHQLDPNPDPKSKDYKNNSFYRLKQANDLLKSANSEIAVQKATAMIMAEQVRLQQMQLQYDTIKAKYQADERANEEVEDRVSECIYDNLHKGDIKKCKNL